MQRIARDRHLSATLHYTDRFLEIHHAAGCKTLRATDAIRSEQTPDEASSLIFHQDLACTKENSCILEMPRSVMRGASLPARFPQVGRIRALCVGTPRCLKSFPISVVQYYRARALRCCREYAVPLLGKHAYQTSGLALGPDCLGLSKRIHRAFLRESSNRIAKARKTYGVKKGGGREKERGWKERRKGKGRSKGTWDHANKCVVECSKKEFLLVSHRNNILLGFFILSNKSKTCG